MSILPFRTNMSEAPSLGDILENFKNNKALYVAHAEQLFADYLTEQDTKIKSYRLVLVILVLMSPELNRNLAFQDKMENEFNLVFALARKNDPLNKNFLISFLTFINPRDQFERYYGADLQEGITKLLMSVNNSYLKP